jgi:hypothetical protein
MKNHSKLFFKGITFGKLQNFLFSVKLSFSSKRIKNSVFGNCRCNKERSIFEPRICYLIDIKLTAIYGSEMPALHAGGQGFDSLILHK